ncbi:hypothetical protein [Clostridium coskatii]|uniref:Uncharacterized protein n=1 Tax=Clostridium coskatii TaxID=1705578 RepID=A0A166T121_9CLOT|nr:hypothetical protein [Clostridium coskatii]OAA93041.1 hypothetical protein WX73_00359 [Clostridium coskatii]OBR90784.1 hypothetical protein CLCOS_37590 [Clostridium coskatii]
MNRDKPWYRQPVEGKEFRKGLKETKIFRLYMLLASLTKEEREGQKVSTRIAVVRREIERRKKS